MPSKYTHSNFYERNVTNKSNDRILKLSVVDNQKPKNSIGLVDVRLFTGDNEIHAIQDAGLWSLRYDKGTVPAAIQQKFTSFSQLLRVAKNYFALRNIEVKEIVDAPAA